MTNAVSWFADVGIADRPTVGGKGGSLGELTQAGIAVPPGFVVTTFAFEEFLAALETPGETTRGLTQAFAQRRPQLPLCFEESNTRLK